MDVDTHEGVLYFRLPWKAGAEYEQHYIVTLSQIETWSFDTEPGMLDDLIALGRIADELPDEPEYDIASERWEVHLDGPNTLIVDGDRLHLAKRVNASSGQMALMTAAPELYSVVRQLHEKYHDTKEKYPDGDTLFWHFLCS